MCCPYNFIQSAVLYLVYIQAGLANKTIFPLLVCMYAFVHAQGGGFIEGEGL